MREKGAANEVPAPIEGMVGQEREGILARVCWKVEWLEGCGKNGGGGEGPERIGSAFPLLRLRNNTGEERTNFLFSTIVSLLFVTGKESKSRAFFRVGNMS